MEKEPSSTSLAYISTCIFNTRSVPFVYRNRYKLISYAYSETILSWNWETGFETEMNVPVQEFDCISAIQELRNGKLVVGTDYGCIYVQTKYSWLYISSRNLLGDIPVSRLIVVGPAHIFVKSSNGGKLLLNTYSKETTKFRPQTKVRFYRDDIIACLSGSKAQTYSVWDLRKALHSINDRNGFAFTKMRVQREQFILLKHQNNTQFTIWDVENVRSWVAPLNNNIHTDQFRTLAVINFTTFVVPDWDGSVFLKRISYNERRHKWYSSRSDPAGSWEVTSLVYTDGYIVYATIPDGSGIHTFDEDLNLLDTSQELTHDGNARTWALKSLDNGYYAIQFKGSIRIVQRKNYSKMLLIGEGDFSYTEALINKHSQLARAIVATEIKDRDEIEEEERLQNLEDMGVELLFGVDAQMLHLYDRFSFRRFKRIHWNCPYGESYDSMSNGEFQAVIMNFFNSCSKIQRAGDRVYVALMQEGDYWIQRQIENPIVLGSVLGGYVLIAKRVFGSVRYPGYEHRTTAGFPYYPHDDDDEMREFVFQKVSRRERSIRKSQLESLSNDYFDCDTDYDSSCYEDSSDDE